MVTICTFGQAQYVIMGSISSQGVKCCYAGTISLFKGLPCAWRHKLNLLSSDDVIATLHFVALPRVVEGRVCKLLIGLADRPVQILLNTRNMQVRSRKWRQIIWHDLFL